MERPPVVVRVTHRGQGLGTLFESVVRRHAPSIIRRSVPRGVLRIGLSNPGIQPVGFYEQRSGASINVLPQLRKAVNRGGRGWRAESHSRAEKWQYLASALL